MGKTTDDEKWKEISDTWIVKEQLKFDAEPPTMKEIKKAIRKFKNNKAPGPDEIPMEFLKDLDDEGLEKVREIYHMVEKRASTRNSTESICSADIQKRRHDEMRKLPTNFTT